MAQIGKLELIGPGMDKILDAINFINDNFEGAKVKPMDWSLMVSGRYSILVELDPAGDEGRHVRDMNDLLHRNEFDCKIYKTE